MSTSTDGSPPGIDYVAVEESPRFDELKRKHRSFVWPLTVAFLLWYFAYVLLSSFATEFVSTRVWGDITIGLLLGLGQFVTTFAITMWYVSYANRKLDPLSAEIRTDLEKQEAGA
ncbi:DUF485 domain-containing protein [Microbacterium telephonicum]|uniref:Uncharacterized membrane protein (DUF485 family) n=1 Tax=Microbacterium telephonicum TaxID=1714841 RepID=A0A498BTP2_9MICO|nr:DUF485 domain-containing protein [Microbacterium telephonicum]RLK47354.1 uncharacterized membrane protein (DUF485 family) [Microbacterium telephonicum]